MSESAKPVTKFNLNSVDDMKRARDQAIAMLEKHGVKDSRTQESQSDNNEETETVEQLKQRLQERDELLNLIAQREFEKKRAQLGAPDTITTVEELKAYSEGKRANQPEKPIPMGNVPLDTQTPANPNQGFGSYPEMIDSLRDLSSAQNPDIKQRQAAKATLDKLMEKAFAGQKEAQKPFSMEMDKETSLRDLLNQKYQRRKALSKGEFTR